MPLRGDIRPRGSKASFRRDTPVPAVRTSELVTDPVVDPSPPQVRRIRRTPPPGLLLAAGHDVVRRTVVELADPLIDEVGTTLGQRNPAFAAGCADGTTSCD